MDHSIKTNQKRNAEVPEDQSPPPLPRLALGLGDLSLEGGHAGGGAIDKQFKVNLCRRCNIGLLLITAIRRVYYKCTWKSRNIKSKV